MRVHRGRVLMIARVQTVTGNTMNHRLRETLLPGTVPHLFSCCLLIGMTGVLLWPLFYFRVLGTYPATAHARLMVEGFSVKRWRGNALDAGRTDRCNSVIK